jgi:hypothetical protein
MKTTTGSLVISTALLAGTADAFGIFNSHRIAFQSTRNNPIVAFATVPDIGTTSFSSLGEYCKVNRYLIFHFWILLFHVACTSSCN